MRFKAKQREMDAAFHAIDANPSLLLQDQDGERAL
jgi:hypothetical protein